MAKLMLFVAVLAYLGVVAVLGQYEDFPRNVTKVLYVDNGVSPGTWRREEFCPHGSYAAGFELKYEDPVLFDDSGLNAIQLVCIARDPNDDLSYGTADSHNGAWGQWMGRLMCTGATPDDRLFVDSFQLRVEGWSLFGYKGATNAAFRCSEIDYHYNGYEIQGNGGDEGKWGDWSQQCEDGNAVCGIAIHFEEPNFIDETALGDAVMFCCND